MKNTFKFHFVSKDTGKMFLRINFFIDMLPYEHFTVGSTCFNIVNHHSNNVDKTLKMKENPKSDFQCCTTMIQCRVQRWNNVKSTLHNVNAIFFRRCTMSFQRCFNVDMTLSQRCFNVVSTSVKAISKPLWLVKSTDLQKDW